MPEPTVSCVVQTHRNSDISKLFWYNFNFGHLIIKVIDNHQIMEKDYHKSKKYTQ